jgi:hypothetical protein
MKKKLTFLVVIIFIANLSFAQKHKESALERYSRVKFRVTAIGDRVTGVNENCSLINVAEILKELKKIPAEKNSSNVITYTYTGCSTIYDLVSNATPQNIIQDPNNPNKIHVACMSSPWGDAQPEFPGRRVEYYYSSNKGVSFDFVGNVTELRSGFPQITLTPTGIELISFNSGSGSTEKTQWYLDAAAGLGSWTALYPALYTPYLYARTVFTNSLTNPVKFVTVVSSNDLDSVFHIGCQSLNPAPGTFSSPNFINAKPAECYCIAKGDDGRIGIVYIANNLLQPTDIGDIYFIESTNNGISFSNPTKIFDANISSTGDSLGAFRGISMVYLGNNPKVVFETVKQTTNGYYFPGAPAKIRFWSTSLPGTDPNRSIVIVDTSEVPFRPYISKGTNNDLFASLCRPTIGRSASNDYLFMIFMVPSNCAGGRVDSNSFMDMRFICSTNSGAYWLNIFGKINSSFPRLDYTYPCISPINDVISNTYYVNMVFLMDTIPGSYINHPANGQSLARYMFLRVNYNDIYYGNIEPSFLLVSPANGATNVLLNPTLIWECNVGGTVRYRVQLSTEQTFNTVKFDTIVTPKQVTVPLGKLNISTTYFWRVCVGDSLGFSDWSYVWNFTTRSTGINTISSEIPKEYKLYQNYPNPFNPTTKIRFDLPKASDTKLIVYDILGKDVATLLNEKLSSGTYEVIFDGINLSSGIYFYKLESCDFTDVKRFILIK